MSLKSGILPPKAVELATMSSASVKVKLADSFDTVATKRQQP